MELGKGFKEAEFMKGCPYSEWNWEKDCEVCRLTGKPTEGAIMCDFGFDEECDEYKNKKSRKKVL